jgi:hypothetical protein
MTAVFDLVENQCWADGARNPSVSEEVIAVGDVVGVAMR